MQKLSDDIRSEIRRLVAEGLSKAEVARRLGLSRQVVIRYSDGVAKAAPGVEAKAAAIDERAGTATVAGTSETPIRTLEDALAFAEVDPLAWQVDRWEVGSYQVTLKVRDGDAEKPVTRTMWRVRVYLKRVASKPLLEAIDRVYARLAKAAPRYPAVRRRRPLSGHLLEVLLFDVHFGKLCWAPETGQNFDLKAADRDYREGIAAMLGMASGWPVERHLLPLGNDFLHFDDHRSQTTRGTQVDSDGRYGKVYEVAFEAVNWAVERMAETAPVDVVWVPGNHDRRASWHLCRELAARFSKHRGVAVDVGHSPRKYYRYGSTLLGYTHGDKERHSSLPSIMATERPEDWAATTRREWRIGHLHQTRVGHSSPVSSHDGVVVRMVQAISGIDAWHHEQGYVGNDRAAEAYLHAPDASYRVHFEASARREP